MPQPEQPREQEPKHPRPLVSKEQWTEPLEQRPPRESAAGPVLAEPLEHLREQRPAGAASPPGEKPPILPLQEQMAAAKTARARAAVDYTKPGDYSSVEAGLVEAFRRQRPDNQETNNPIQ